MSGGRLAVFLLVVLGIWSLLHAYVFWRLASVAWISEHVSVRTLIITAIALWLSYPLARLLEVFCPGRFSHVLEYIGGSWMGLLFLLFSALLLVELISGGGWLLPRIAPALRGWAAVAALILALVAATQALRPPVVREQSVALQGLPPELDGTVLVALSDLHLGSPTMGDWTERLIDRVNGMRPDLVVLVGDIIDGDAERLEPLLPILRQLRAPLGVWAVTGNHEFYVGAAKSSALLRAAGYEVLRDRLSEAAPGLIVAGVDDLTARRQFGDNEPAVARLLARRPPGGLILLSHSSWEAEEAAAFGAGLMLSGHTHEGQIWPFNYLVKLRYPLLGGRYEINGMPMIVCRGSGTWGPPMRLWRPSEIVRIELRSETGPR
jgi:predicted MPP superfamily phosphohydrolase